MKTDGGYMPLRVFEAFAGIGAQATALERLNANLKLLVLANGWLMLSSATMQFTIRMKKQ